MKRGVMTDFQPKWMIIIVAVVFVSSAVGGIACAQSGMRTYDVNTLVTKAEQYSRQSGKAAQALSYMNKAIQMEPSNKQLYYRRALMLGRLGSYPAAIQELSRFVNTKEYPHAVRFRGDCFMGVNDFRSAAKDYRAFLRRSPKDGKVWFYLGESYALMGDKKSAIEAINRGLATGSHWSDRLLKLKSQVMTNQTIKPHKPLSN